MRFFLISLCATLLCFGLSTLAFGEDHHERTRVGHNITIGPGEEVPEATCFGCSIRVRGHVTGDVTTFGGSILIEDQAEVGGDATSFGGSVRLAKDVKVGGDVTVFGGKVHRDSEATVGGDITNMSGPGWIVLIFVLPLVLFGAFVALIVWLIWRLVRRATVPATV